MNAKEYLLLQAIYYLDAFGACEEVCKVMKGPCVLRRRAVLKILSLARSAHDLSLGEEEGHLVPVGATSIGLHRMLHAAAPAQLLGLNEATMGLRKLMKSR